MDPAKAAFLEEIDDDLEPDEGDDVVPARLAFRDTVRRQIVNDDPPQVWRTAQRLLGDGVAAADAWHQLVLAYASGLVATAGEAVRFDRDGYVAALDRLPLPSPERVAQLIVTTVRDRQPVSADEVDDFVAAQLGLPSDDPLTKTVLERVLEELLDEHEGTLAILAPDLLLHVPSMLDGIVLTHRLTEGERESDTLLAIDLPGFARMGLRHGDRPVVESVAADGRSRWYGPPDWLLPYPADALLAVRVAPDGQVMLSALDEEPAPADELVAAVGAVYDAEVSEAWLPVPPEDLVLGVLATDRTAFTRPVPPLSELAAAAGLQERDEHYARDESVWRHAEAFGRIRRIHDLHGHGPVAQSACYVLDLLDEGPLDHPEAREILHALADPQVLDVVLDELCRFDDSGLAPAFDASVPTLLRVAARPGERAVARLLAGVACERSGAVLEAESHLREAVRANPGWPPAEDRLAWYEADRGDADAATARWRRLGLTPAESQDLETAEQYTAAAGPEPGRNAPCWCGSGRKYKTCHRGRPAVTPLPDRVNWLCRKAVAYLERRGGLFPAMLEFAMARAADPDDLRSVKEAVEDPLVLDVALHEAGWFERFLRERGPLLPPDEAMLGQAWTLVDRSVYEVLDIAPGHGVTLRDVRTGDRIETRERTFSRHARGGELVCARVVPDGESHQFIGGLFRVPPGTEGPLLELLDRHDGFGLLSFVAQLSRPPTLVTTDGEPLLDCRVRLTVPDPAAARAELDRRYEPDGSSWVSYLDPDAPEPTIRAWLDLDGEVLSVRTISEPRLEAVLAELRTALPGARVDRDERQPVAPDAGPPPEIGVVDEAMREALQQLVDRHERQWCEESVPALGGRTPREAAADPSRREELARLIATFPEIDPASGMFGLRPARLRELLDLPAEGR